MAKTTLDLDRGVFKAMEDFRNRIKKIYKHIGKQARKKGVTCYRLYDNDLPDFPFCIDVYESHLHFSLYEKNEEPEIQWIGSCLQIMAEELNITIDNIHLKQRKKQKGSEQYEKNETEPSLLVVKENDLKFKVNMDEYLDTGLFLDHRDTRSMVKSNAAGKRVLNLFAYTGAFSVYAAAGGASEVVTIDMSQPYTQWAKDNMMLNGYDDTSKYFFIADNVLDILPRLEPDYFDIIILDPPTFSNSKKMHSVFDIQHSHVPLILDCLYTLKSGGQLYFSTNYKRFKLDFEAIPAHIKDITEQTRPFDFQRKMHRYCYLITK